MSPVATKEKYKEVVVQRPERGEEVQDDRVRDMNKIETDQYSMMPTGTKSNRNDDPKREEVQTYETAEDNVSPIFTIESSKGITTVAVPPHDFLTLMPYFTVALASSLIYCNQIFKSTIWMMTQFLKLFILPSG